jgi:hypothetical protein
MKNTLFNRVVFVTAIITIVNLIGWFVVYKEQVEFTWWVIIPIYGFTASIGIAIIIFGIISCFNLIARLWKWIVTGR